MVPVSAANPLPVTGGGGGGGGAVTIADGANVVEGSTTDAAITTDSNGTISGKLRGLVKILGNVWDSVNSRLNVFIQNPSIAVTGTFWQATQPVSGTVAVSNFPATQPVSGTVTANQGGTWTTTVTQATAANLNATVTGTVAATQSGTWNIGTVTSQTQWNGNTIDTNSGNKSAGTLRVTLATDQVQLTNALKVDGSAVTQPVSGTVTANPTSNTPVLKNGLTNTASAVVSSTAAVLNDYYVYNPNASVAYVQIYDVATAGGVTVGTTTPKWSIGIPATSGANITNLNLTFANGIQVAATTTATGSTAPGTALDCNFGYR